MVVTSRFSRTIGHSDRYSWTGFRAILIRSSCHHSDASFDRRTHGCWSKRNCRLTSIEIRNPGVRDHADRLTGASLCCRVQDRLVGAPQFAITVYDGRIAGTIGRRGWAELAA